MNYLAHLYLSDGTVEGVLGSLMGDFVKGLLGERYTAGIRQAIALHRKIDAYTDAHPVPRASRNRVSPNRRRYAGIMVDVFYDHFLARRWADYSDVPLDAFTQRVYSILAREHASLPPTLQRIAPIMADEDWLTRYRDVSAIRHTLNRMSRRLQRPNPLLDSAEDLELNYDFLEFDFRCFFPDLIDYATRWNEAANLESL